MLSETQLVVAVAGVCVLAAALLVLARRRRRSETRSEQEQSAIVTDEPGRLVLARAHDGTQYQGLLAEPADASARDTYLTLEGPIVFRRPGGEAESMPSAWDRLALPLTDVAEVWTRARVEPTVPSPSAGDTVPGDDPVAPTAAGGDGSADGSQGQAAPGEPTRSERRHARRTSRSAVPTS